MQQQLFEEGKGNRLHEEGKVKGVGGTRTRHVAILGVLVGNDLQITYWSTVLVQYQHRSDQFLQDFSLFQPLIFTHVEFLALHGCWPVVWINQYPVVSELPSAPSLLC